MGTGGAPEGVLTAAAMRCLNGEIFARLVVSKPEHEERCRAMGITDFKKDLPLEGSRAGRRHHLRRDRRHRRHADARRPLLRRRHPHQLADHAERSAPHPVHRQHSRAQHERRMRAGSGSDVPVRSPWQQQPLRASPRPSFIGFTGFTLVMPFLPLYFHQLGVDGRRAGRDVDGPEPRRDAGAHRDARAALGTARRSLRPQDHGRALARQLRRSSWRPWRSSRARGTCFALRAVQGLFAGYGALTLTMAADSAPQGKMAQAIGIVQTAQRLGPGAGPGHRRRGRGARRTAARVLRRRRCSTWLPSCSCSSSTTSIRSGPPTCRRTTPIGASRFEVCSRSRISC